MNRKEWDALERVVQDQLASKHGLTRSGENNSIMNDAELEKIPEEKKPEPKESKKEEDDKPKKKARKIFTKKRSKRSN